MRDFNEWYATFLHTIYGSCEYIDFKTVYKHIDSKDLKDSLNLMNALIGVNDIEAEFLRLIKKYPEITRHIPILLAYRCSELSKDGHKLWVLQKDEETLENGKLANELTLDFASSTSLLKEEAICLKFMRESGLFELIQKRLISNLIDYVCGIEVGLNSHARKNRTGTLMENLIEKYLQQAGLIENKNYIKQASANKIKEVFKIDISMFREFNNKKFDFAVCSKYATSVTLIECNFFTTTGSKSDSTISKYERYQEICEQIDTANFIWITDGLGWSKSNLKKIFTRIKNVYNLTDLENGAFKRLFNEA